MDKQFIELSPKDCRKSFYGKCKVYNHINRLQLVSYTTIVAEYNKDTDQLYIYGYYSQTTKRHIDSFLSYIGKPSMNKKEIEEYINPID